MWVHQMKAFLPDLAVRLLQFWKVFLPTGLPELSFYEYFLLDTWTNILCISIGSVVMGFLFWKSLDYWSSSIIYLILLYVFLHSLVRGLAYFGVYLLVPALIFHLKPPRSSDAVTFVCISSTCYIFVLLDYPNFSLSFTVKIFYVWH